MIRYLSIGLLMLSSAAALADGPSYSYIQGSYQEWDIDSADGDGFGVGGSVAIGDKFHIFADYASVEFESVLDVDLTTAGVGYHHGATEKTDFFVELGFADIDVESLGDDSGLLARIGVRSMISESLELWAAVSETDFDDVDLGTEFGAGAWYTISGNFAVGAEARFADDVDRFGIGIRLFFDK